jgi:hypothetical protein
MSENLVTGPGLIRFVRIDGLSPKISFRAHNILSYIDLIECIESFARSKNFPYFAVRKTDDRILFV